MGKSAPVMLVAPALIANSHFQSTMCLRMHRTLPSGTVLRGCVVGAASHAVRATKSPCVPRPSLGEVATSVTIAQSAIEWTPLARIVGIADVGAQNNRGMHPANNVLPWAPDSI